MTAPACAAERYDIVSVEGGKFHRPVRPEIEQGGTRRPWHPVEMRCGRFVEPSNYFATVADALRYCGGRTEYLCRQCEGADAKTAEGTLRLSPNGVTHTVFRNCATCGMGAHSDWPVA